MVENKTNLLSLYMVIWFCPKHETELLIWESQKGILDSYLGTDGIRELKSCPVIVTYFHHGVSMIFLSQIFGAFAMHITPNVSILVLSFVLVMLILNSPLHTEFPIQLVLSTAFWSVLNLDIWWWLNVASIIMSWLCSDR